MQAPNALRNAPLLLGASLALLSGCATAPPTRAGREDLRESAMDALRGMESSDPSLTGFLRSSAGYAVFPDVGKGGYIVGGGYGRGLVYRGGAEIGFADITQGSIGLQAGGQSYMEVLAFQRQRDLDRFTAGGLAFGASLSAVILKTGAAAAAPYTNGVAVFVKPIAGAMIEAAVGGQQFTYRPE
ncbi:MAG TPA: YSC84-related protein [Anaeromyxobacter sp.]|nr:YSC84-related protein [Anaeromyxobacter sp.]